MLVGHLDCAHAVGLCPECVFVSLFVWLFIWHGGNPSAKNLLPEETFGCLRRLLAAASTLAKVCRLTSGFAIKEYFVVSLPRSRAAPYRGRAHSRSKTSFSPSLRFLQTGR